MMWKRALIILMSAFLFSACSNHKETLFNGESKHGQTSLPSKMALEKKKNHQKSYSSVDQNPNLLDISQPRSNQGTDVNHMRQTILDLTSYDPGAIWINGDKMSVTVYTNKSLSNKNLKKEEKKLHRVLVGAMPRYRIDVKIKEK
jgi:hypothetical protein